MTARSKQNPGDVTEARDRSGVSASTVPASIPTQRDSVPIETATLPAGEVSRVGPRVGVAVVDGVRDGIGCLRPGP